MKTNNKLLVCATLTLLLSSFLVSSVIGTDDNAATDPTPDTPSTGENPVLIATEDTATTGPDSDSGTYQARDNSTDTTIDPPTANDASESDHDLLISTQTSPDYTVYLIAGLALVAIALCSSVIVYLKRKK